MSTDTYTHGAHCVHLADWCELEGQLHRSRTQFINATDDLDDLAHAVIHATNPETVGNLIAQLRGRLSRAADAIGDTLDKARS